MQSASSGDSLTISQFINRYDLWTTRDMPNLSHHSLVAWQRADDLFIRIHRLSLEAFPSYERYELGSQIRRAAYSVAANIAEGKARRYRRARLHFLNIAESSLAEVGYCVHAACRLGYIPETVRQNLDTEIRGVGAPLIGLIRATRAMPLVISTVGLIAALAAVVS